MAEAVISSIPKTKCRMLMTRIPEEDGDDDGDIDWENRTLCVDESCIGVIGPDGRCKECGKPWMTNG